MKVYIIGDMNGRTSNFADILEFDKYIKNEGLIFYMSHVPDQINKDFVTHGRKLLDICKRTGLLLRTVILEEIIMLESILIVPHRV